VLAFSNLLRETVSSLNMGMGSHWKQWNADAKKLDEMFNKLQNEDQRRRTKEAMQRLEATIFSREPGFYSSSLDEALQRLEVTMARLESSGTPTESVWRCLPSPETNTPKPDNPLRPA
jgi:hypothetical protein